MKKKLIVGVFLLLNLLINAQIQDLANLASGDLISFGTINKENTKENGLKEYNIWGYYAIYETDVIDNRNAKYEFVLLDKNLNKFLNNEFQFARIKVLGKVYHMNYSMFYNQEKELTLKASYPYSSNDYYWEINLKENSLSKLYKLDYEGNKVFYDDFDWEDLKTDSKNVKKESKQNKKKLDSKHLQTIDSEYYLTYSYEKEAKNDEQKLKTISYHSVQDSTKLWEQSFNEQANKDSKNWGTYWYRYDMEHPDYLYFLTSDVLKKGEKVKDANFKYKSNLFFSGIMALDKNTGKELFNSDAIRPYNIHWFSLISIKLIENNQIIFLTTDKDEKGKGNDGYRKLTVHSKTGALISDVTISLQDAQSFMEIKKNNKLKKGYELRRRDHTIHDDGSMVIVFEKFKEAKNNVLYVTDSKTTDLVLFSIDKDFKLTDAKTFDKEKTKGYHGDYLFSQYLQNGKGSVYFFQDYIKGEKSWKLGIVKSINGKIMYEEIPISEKDKFTILPYPAKEGSILLREFNKDEKYDQVRLEKLNID